MSILEFNHVRESINSCPLSPHTRKMSGEISTVAKKWQEVLASCGYENKIKSQKDFSRLTRLSRTWKYIFEATNLERDASIFEFGCGGGNQLVPLAIRGYKCSGIDCSEDVLVRCKD